VTERTAIPLHGRANAGTVLATTKLGPAADLLPLQVLRPMMQGRFAPSNRALPASSSLS
jgi:hypothetical protein